MVDYITAFLLLELFAVTPALLVAFAFYPTDSYTLRKYFKEASLLNIYMLLQRLFLLSFYPYDTFAFAATLTAIFMRVRNHTFTRALFTTFMTILCHAVCEFLTVLLLTLLTDFHLPTEIMDSRSLTANSMIPMHALLGILLYFLAGLIYAGNRISSLFSPQGRVYIQTGFVTSLLLLYWIAVLSINFTYVFNQSLLLGAVFYLGVAFNSLFFTNYLITNYNYSKSLKENSSITQQMEMINQFVHELRKFKHNYINILYGFGYIVETSEDQALKDYYTQVIEMSRIINNDNMIAIQRIKNISISNLLLHHIELFSNAGIPFSINVEKEVYRLKIKDIDLCQILGIFLDNAREAAAESPCPQVKLDVLESDELVEIYLYNTFNTAEERSGGEKPACCCGMRHSEVPFGGQSTGHCDQDRMHKNDSGSGQGMECGRGMGLVYAEAILRKYKKILHNTYIRNDMFVQQLVFGK